ncbi:hypothetical protein C8N43_1033 [Litoreibacter ponti]|uniref:Histidine kinase n=1 Tax=Litoreibacter ponti TaxID=1510457 RepID=A0A2T6BJZ3_9RHOB|nr:DUF6446 family protein [Litoreibacter ponti]PTX56376.1 hypothetical protein C8N43_1033 [Litoreibacter ponti]
MSGKLVGIAIMIIALTAGAWMYYLQVYAFYEEVQTPDPVALTSVATGAPEDIIADAITAIDADSSPIRYRACFETPMSHALLTETYELAVGAEPLVAPDWFDCFDAQEIGEALQTGEALAFLGQENIEYGVDRIVAIFEDGRGYVWQQLNDCGRKAYDGTQVGPDCPARENTGN